MTYLTPKKKFKKNPYLFVTTEPNQMFFFAEMQKISYSFIILKNIQINSQF